MAQNIYDHAEFFEEYSNLPRSTLGISAVGTPEWAILSSYIPPLQGARFLDLGCGFGWYSRWAREQGAISVTGIDVSEKMLEVAKQRAQDPAISYLKADLESVDLPRGAYDVVFSSLTLHYVENYAPLVKKIYDSLAPGGTLVFSVEHPTYTAPTKQKWTKDEEGVPAWLLNNYMKEGRRTNRWLGDEDIVEYHRMTSTYVQVLLKTGFVLSAMEDWGPTIEQIEELRPLYTKCRESPAFLLIKAVKPDI